MTPPTFFLLVESSSSILSGPSDAPRQRSSFVLRSEPFARALIQYLGLSKLSTRPSHQRSHVCTDPFWLAMQGTRPPPGSTVVGTEPHPADTPGQQPPKIHLGLHNLFEVFRESGAEEKLTSYFFKIYFIIVLQSTPMSLPFSYPEEILCVFVALVCIFISSSLF
jgi:hypothetical protein